jgi:hypothetical protein
VEDEDDEENLEVFIDGEGEANEDTVEDDAELEDTNTDNLRRSIRAPGPHPAVVMAGRRLRVRRHLLLLVSRGRGLGLGSMSSVRAKAMSMRVYGRRNQTN